MKTNILLTLFLIVCLSIKADDTFYRTLVDGRCWNFMEIYQNDNKTDTVYYSIEIEGEVEFDEKLCYRIKGYETEAFIPYLYEDGGKVFTYKWDKTTESMVWEKVIDYTIKTNEQRVSSVDKIDVKGKLCRRIVFDDGRYDNTVWVESIGSNHDGPFIGSGTVIGTFRGRKLLSVYDGDELIFEEDDFMAPAVTGIKTVTRDKSENNTFYDLQGRRLTATPQRGVYIRDGKKYVVKE